MAVAAALHLGPPEMSDALLNVVHPLAGFLVGAGVIIKLGAFGIQAPQMPLGGDLVLLGSAAETPSVVRIGFGLLWQYLDRRQFIVACSIAAWVPILVVLRIIVPPPVGDRVYTWAPRMTQNRRA